MKHILLIISCLAIAACSQSAPDTNTLDSPSQTTTQNQGSSQSATQNTTGSDLAAERQAIQAQVHTAESTLDTARCSSITDSNRQQECITNIAFEKAAQGDTSKCELILNSEVKESCQNF